MKNLLDNPLLFLVLAAIVLVVLAVVAVAVVFMVVSSMKKLGAGREPGPRGDGPAR